VRPTLFDGVKSLLFFGSFGGSRIPLEVLSAFESTFISIRNYSREIKYL
jgi:hypothetical protein